MARRKLENSAVVITGTSSGIGRGRTPLHSNRDLATSLSLSEATVKRHLANIYSRIGVHFRGEAVRKALHEEWITI